RLRLAFPPGGAHGPEPLWTVRPGQHPVAHVGVDSHIADHPRQVHRDRVLGQSAARASCKRPGLGGERAKGPALDRARAARAAPQEPAVRGLPQQHRPGRVRARELRRGRLLARPDSRGAEDRLSRRARGRHARRWANRAPQRAARETGAVCDHGHAEAADLRSRPRARARRYAGRPRHREKCGKARLQLEVYRFGYSGLLSVPEPAERVGIGGGYGRAGEGVGRHVYYQEASEPTNVPARRGHGTGPAAAGRDDPCSDGADAHRLRFGAIYMPNGIYPGLWHPEKVGKNFEFNRTMKPLEPWREYLTTISGMKAPDGNKDMGGIHMGASAAFLNGTGPLGKNGQFNLVESKKSIDQHIADAIGGDTPLRSLELGTEDMSTAA